MTTLELFPCSGGMAEGFRRAGIIFDHAFDYSADACESYGANLGHRPVQIDVRDLVRLARAGWSPGPVDLLVADPPCTPWSRAGKRKGLEDERDMLRETVELIGLLRPRAYLIGNVPGLEDGPSWKQLQRVLAPLSLAGYCVLDFAVLDAADYGVPQHRVRPFWFGHLDGPCIRWPERTHENPTKLATSTIPGVAPLLPWVTCRDALGHLPPEDLGRPVRLRWREKAHADHAPSSPDAPARTLTQNSMSDGALLAHPRHPVSLADEPSRVGAGEAHVFDWPWERPSQVVCTGIDKIAAAGEHEGHKGPNAIVLSERAAAILQGFPEGWTFAGATKKARWSQIGMAMPPPLAHAVATSVAEQLSASRARVA